MATVMGTVSQGDAAWTGGKLNTLQTGLEFCFIDIVCKGHWIVVIFVFFMIFLI